MNEMDRLPLFVFIFTLSENNIFFCIINSKLYSDETKQQEKTCTNILKNISHFHNKIKKYGKQQGRTFALCDISEYHY